MSKFQKSVMSVDGNRVNMSMPFAKVDREKRLVHGWATMDNLDTQDDIVVAEASAKAFARARGNIREMHQPIAVGKMIDFREDEYFDPEDKQLYRGIFVTARVSKGAQDTWEKVLDGTLSGFSIGGEIKEVETDFNKDAGRSVRKILDYDLTELSLVDNPANQKANFTAFEKGVASFTKAADGSVAVEQGEVTKTVVENVFICSADSTVIVKATDSETCPQCGANMENAGWFETGDERAEKVNNIVTKFLTPATDKEAAPSSEGGVEMFKSKKVESNPLDQEVGVVNPSEEETKENPTSVPAEATEADEAEDETAEVDETDGTEEEEAESPEEVTDEETEISKKMDALHQAIQDALESNNRATSEKVDELSKTVAEATDAFMKKASELEGKISEFGDNLKAAKMRLAELETSLNKMNASDAIKKSAELENNSSGNIVQKDVSWNGAFSGKSGNGFSVDNLT
jgi:hypothetical protein